MFYYVTDSLEFEFLRKLKDFKWAVFQYQIIRFWFLDEAVQLLFSFWSGGLGNHTIYSITYPNNNIIVNFHQNFWTLFRTFRTKLLFASKQTWMHCNTHLVRTDGAEGFFSRVRRQGKRVDFGQTWLYVKLHTHMRARPCKTQEGETMVRMSCRP